MRRIRFYTLTLALALLIFAPKMVVQAASLAISSKSATIEVGKTRQLTVSGTKQRITWTSSNKAVATVATNGTITAKAPGTATITASVAGRKLSSKITVIKPITINKSAIQLEQGKKQNLVIRGTTKTVTWSTNNKAIATVSGSGAITAKAPGTATITASVAGKKLTCKVTVVKPITISDNSIRLEEGEAKKLIISGTKKTVTWTSSNKAVAKVTSKGTVKAISEGTATITASVDGKKLTCKITVIKPILISEDILILEVGEKEKLYISGTEETITWKSSNIAVATVSSKGTVTGIAEGNATITADVAGKKLTCTITVVTPIVLNHTSLRMIAGTTGKLEISGGESTSLWTSSQKRIAQVSTDGTITAISQGTTIITAYIDGKRLKCQVQVTNPDNVTEQGFYLELGDTKVSISARGITEGVIFASDNPEVAVIGPDGFITPISTGITTLTASVEDRVYSYLVTIIDPLSPYVKKAPFPTKEIHFNKLGFVAPSRWVISSENYENTFGLYIMQPTDTSETGAMMTIMKAEDGPLKYWRLKSLFSGVLTEKFFRELYEFTSKEHDLIYAMTGFKQGDYQADFGKVFKTEYTVTIDGERTKQVIYLFMIDEYFVQITASDIGDDKNFIRELEYMLNSFTLK